MYAHVTNGFVDATGPLPDVWVHDDGSQTSGFPFLTDAEHAAAGWLPLVDNPPAYDPATQMLGGETYAVTANEVVRTWLVVAKPPTPPKSGLDATGVIATLNAVVGVWTLTDAANAVHLTEQALIDEALGWAVAAAL